MENTAKEIESIKQDIIKGIVQELNRYWTELKKKYNINDKGKYPLYIYTFDELFELIANGDIPLELAFAIDIGGGGEMSSFSYPIFKRDNVCLIDDNEDKDTDIVTDIDSMTLMSIDRLWNTIEFFHYTLDDVLKYMQIKLKRELGHTLYAIEEFVGNNRKYIHDFKENIEESFEKLYKLDIDSDAEYALMRRKYVPGEERGDELVSVTEKDIIEAYKDIKRY